MSKETKSPETTDQLPEKVKLPKSKDLETWTEEEVIAALESAEEGQELTSEYLGKDSFEEGEEKRFLFQGKARMTPMENAENIGPDGKVPAVRFYGVDKKMYITAATVLVSSCENLELNDPVGITFKGMVGSKKKQYADFKVTKLMFKK
jgi:hypothetical protein